LKDIANREKMVPREFITEDGFHINSRCRQYLAPLIVGEDPPPFRNGLPVYVKLKNVPVRKKLQGEFKI
jgi:6-phosphofructokinase 1